MKIFAKISWFYATVIIVVSLTLMILTYPFLPRPLSRKLSAWSIKYLTFFSVELKGEEDLNTQIFLINHQSDLDIVVMELISKKDFTWVAKKELFAIPFLGLALRLPKDIAVDRESKSSLVKLIKDAKVAIEAKRTIAMFPEGTRSSGAKMLPFKAGAKILADTYSLVVQPVVIIDSASHFNTKKFIYKPGKIKAIFLDSFVADKNDKEWLKNLQIKMQKVYDSELSNNNSSR